MTLEAHTAPTPDSADSIFDFARHASRPVLLTTAELAALRAEPETGWAAANPERAMLFLFLAPRDGRVAEELLAA
jgi:hypothetical protein